MGTQLSLSQRGTTAQFSAHFYCSQTAGWFKMALGTEVALGAGHIVLDGNPAPPPQKGGTPPIFGPFLLWPNGWIDQDATWYEGRLRRRPHCVRWGRSCPPKTPIFTNFRPMLDGNTACPKEKGTQPPNFTNFRSMSVVVKRLDGSRCHLVRR